MIRVLAIIGIIGGLTCMVLEPLRLCLFVKYTEELVRENGDAGVDGYYKTIRNCFSHMIRNTKIIRKTPAHIFRKGGQCV